MELSKIIYTFAAQTIESAIRTNNNIYHSRKMEYYISLDNNKIGPYTITELQSRGLSAETLVMAADSDQWVPAWQVEELRPVIKTAQQLPVGSAAKGNVAQDEPKEQQKTEKATQQATNEDNVQAQQTNENNSMEQNFQMGHPVPPHKKSHAGCWVAILIFIIAIAGVAIVTCPGEQEHKAALSQVVTATMDEEINGTDTTAESSDIVSKLFNQISSVWTKKVVDEAVDNLIYVDNNVLFSMGKVRFGGKAHTVSLGVFGHVFTTDKKNLKEAARRYYDRAEQNVKVDLQKKAEKLIKENVIDPAANTVKEIINGAIGEIMSDMGLSTDGTRPDEHLSPEEESVETDSL